SPLSPAEPPHRSSPRIVTPSNPGFRAVFPSASTSPTPPLSLPTQLSKAQTSPTSTVNPQPFFSSPSTNTRSPSLSCNGQRVPHSPRSLAPEPALVFTKPPPRTSTSLPSATSTRPISTTL